MPATGSGRPRRTRSGWHASSMIRIPAWARDWPRLNPVLADGLGDGRRARTAALGLSIRGRRDEDAVRQEVLPRPAAYRPIGRQVGAVLDRPGGVAWKRNRHHRAMLADSPEIAPEQLGHLV